MATSYDGVGQITSRAIGTIARTDTSAKNLFTLKAGSIPVRVSYYAGTASNAVTTATISVGRTGTATYFLNAADVKTAATATGQQTPTTNVTNMHVALTSDTVVTGTYAESGGASSTGGPWTVMIEYIDPAN